MRLALAEAFSKKLPYTSDGFDADRFKGAVCNINLPDIKAKE